MNIIINSFEQGVVSNKEVKILRRVVIFFDTKDLVIPKLIPTKKSGQTCVRLSVIILTICCAVYILETYTPEQVISMLRLVIDLVTALKQ